MLELHVWGPAFGLPSIDPRCLAAIAYLQQAVPRGKWQLVASSDPTLSPTNELPALRNGDRWIGGFRNIFHYIAQYSAGEWILDAGLPEQQAADCVAFSSFIESHGQPLLDLSLYVSTLNYTTTTRPLFNTIQAFPMPYLTPTSLRAAAKRRTEHLNLSSLDIDSEDGQPLPEQSIIPESLRRPKDTISSLLAATPETSAQIRLDALATDFFEPLSKLKGRKQFFVSDSQFSSLDCLALGCLSLMLIPELPQPWLSKTMKSKFPALCAWTEEFGNSIFGGPATLDDAFLTKLGDSEQYEKRRRARENAHLPWKAVENGGVLSVGSAFISTMADSIPVVGQLKRNTRLRQHGGKTTDDEAQSSSWRYVAMFGSLVAGFGLLAGYILHQGVFSSSSSEDAEKEERSGGFGDFGEAGAALSVLARQMDVEARQRRAIEKNHPTGDPVVEIDVDIERGSVSTTNSIS